MHTDVHIVSELWLASTLYITHWLNTLQVSTKVQVNEINGDNERYSIIK